MRSDLYGLLKIILPHAPLKITWPQTKQQPLVWLFVDRGHLKYIFALLRYSSLFHTTRAIDVSGYEITQNTAPAHHQLLVAYIFALPTWHIKLCITTTIHSYQQITPASRFFPGLTWGERELSELLGINFLHKVDARRLMLDYAFEGHPLRKNFPAIGFEELSYSAKDRWLIYTPLRTRDEIDF